MSHFFCVSYFDGDINWLPHLSAGKYIVFAKGALDGDALEPAKIRTIPNVGYNIHSYLTFIVDHYDALPEHTVFCKNNVFPRHVTEERFRFLVRRRIFTPIEEPARWDRLGYPMSLRASDNGYLELNNSWYTSHYRCKYFKTFDAFYRYVFADPATPRYLRFAPGANYVVPRDHVLLRSRAFYANLLAFVSHDTLAGESHIIERALMAIWTSTVAESSRMSQPLLPSELERLAITAAAGDTIERVRLTFVRATNKANVLLHCLAEKALPLRQHYPK